MASEKPSLPNPNRNRDYFSEAYPKLDPGLWAARSDGDDEIINSCPDESETTVVEALIVPGKGDRKATWRYPLQRRFATIDGSGAKLTAFSDYAQ